MAFQDLREFIAFLEQRGQLRRITAPVSAELEITEITDRVSKAGGPALLFENVEGYDMPVLINLFGSPERMSWALGVNSLDELGDRIKRWLDIVQNRPPDGLIEKAKLAPELLRVDSHWAEDCHPRPLPGSRSHRQPLARPLPDPQVLAARRRTLHHPHHVPLQGPCDREAQHRHVSRPGLRRAHGGHALANPQGRRGPLPRGRES